MQPIVATSATKGLYNESSNLSDFSGFFASLCGNVEVEQTSWRFYAYLRATKKLETAVSSAKATPIV